MCGATILPTALKEEEEEEDDPVVAIPCLFELAAMKFLRGCLIADDDDDADADDDETSAPVATPL